MELPHSIHIGHIQNGESRCLIIGRGKTIDLALLHALVQLMNSYNSTKLVLLEQEEFSQLVEKSKVLQTLRGSIAAYKANSTRRKRKGAK